ncbi:protein of unknown function [bacterium A37T11]|nr:protein of unknown function [bacterium A37T11]
MKYYPLNGPFLKKIIVVLVLLSSLTACQKDKLPPATYEDGIWFYASASAISGNDADAKLANAFTGNYTFYFYPEAIQDTFLLPEVRVMGDPKNYDRSFSMIVADSSSAKEGVHFKFLNTVVPAGQVSTTPSLILLNTPDLLEKKVDLYLQLEPSADFPAVMGRDTLSADKSFLFSTHYHLTFNNLIQSPPYWSTVPYLGKWSAVKFEFINSIIGFFPGLVPVTSDEYSQYYSYYLHLRSALADYNSAHPGEPLTDENNKAVSF